MLDFIESVQRRDPVPFRISGIVEHLIDKVIDPRVKAHRHLADVDHLGCGPADDMDA